MPSSLRRKEDGRLIMFRKKMTLAEHVEKILQKAGGPMEVKAIAQSLKARGVSKAKTLSTQVGQVLKAMGAKKV